METFARFGFVRAEQGVLFDVAVSTSSISTVGAKAWTCSPAGWPKSMTIEAWHTGFNEIDAGPSSMPLRFTGGIVSRRFSRRLAFFTRYL